MMPHRFELTFQLHGFSRLSFALYLLQKTVYEHRNLSSVKKHAHYSPMKKANLCKVDEEKFNHCSQDKTATIWDTFVKLV